MKIGFISDTHGDLKSLQEVLKGPLAGINILIHSGDVLYHGPRNPLVEGYNPGEMANYLNSLNIPLIIAQGNCDSQVDQMVLNWPLLSPYAFCQVDGTRILAVHGHNSDIPQYLEEAQRFKARILVTGHTHIPLLERHGPVIHLNPGSPSLPKGEGKATVGVLTEGRICLLDAKAGDIIKDMEI